MRTVRTEHEERVVACLNTECKQYRVLGRQCAMQLALDPVDFKEYDRVFTLVFLPVYCASCGLEMRDQEPGE